MEEDRSDVGDAGVDSSSRSSTCDGGWRWVLVWRRGVSNDDVGSAGDGGGKGPSPWPGPRKSHAEVDHSLFSPNLSGKKASQGERRGRKAPARSSV